MRRDQTRAPEPMRSTLPNTDQPRIPHSEYHYTCLKQSVLYYQCVLRAWYELNQSGTGWTKCGLTPEWGSVTPEWGSYIIDYIVFLLKAKLLYFYLNLRMVLLSLQECRMA